MKGLLAIVALLGIAGYFSGIFDAGYSRDVGRPQAQVMAALADLDITAQPGAPGSTAEAAGGIKPLFRVEKTADHMTWYVMSGKQVAMKMTATFEPLDNGSKTRVRASVERGDAPDDFVSPAFRSKSITMGLFSMALEGELNKLASTTARYDPAKCQALMRQFEQGNLASGMTDRPDNLSQAMGQTSKAMMRIAAMEAELRRNGCPTDKSPSGFDPYQPQMEDGGDEDNAASRREEPRPGAPDADARGIAPVPGA